MNHHLERGKKSTNLITNFIFDLIFLLFGHLVAATYENCSRFQLPRSKPSSPASGNIQNNAIVTTKGKNKNKIREKFPNPMKIPPDRGLFMSGTVSFIAP
jgi:hypothetical protein